MKILFRDGSGIKSVQLINMIREKLEPEFAMICSTEDQRGELEINGNELILDYYALLEGTYDENLAVPPIDEKILLQLSPYYGEIFRIIGRNGAFYYSYPKREELFLKTVRYWDWALDHYGIDLYLGFAVPHFSFEIIIHYLCKIKKIKTLYTWYTNVPTYMHFVEDINEIGEEVLNPYYDFLEKFRDSDIREIPLCEDFQKNYELHTLLTGDRTPLGIKETSLEKATRRMRGIFSYYKYLQAMVVNIVVAFPKIY